LAAEGMERYWDLRAGEDPFHYVDNRQRPGAPDLEAFWHGGDEVIDGMLSAVGVELTGHERVVEIGCGVGRLTRVLAQRAASVDALDVSEVMLEHARRYNPQLENVRWIHGDGETLAPLPDRAFDACVSFVVFQHLPDPELTYGYVREIGRVLQPGGWGAFQVSTDPRVHRRPPALRRLIRHLRAWLGRGPRGQSDPAWLGSAVTIDALRAAAADGGLELERVENEGSQFCLVLVRRRR
jgi:SAM-dependent methyltransferase